MPSHPHDGRHPIAVWTDAARSPFGLLADAHARAQQHAARRSQANDDEEAPRAEPTPRGTGARHRVAAALGLQRSTRASSWPAPIHTVAASAAGLAIARWFHLAVERLGSGP